MHRVNFSLLCVVCLYNYLDALMTDMDGSYLKSCDSISTIFTHMIEDIYSLS